MKRSLLSKSLASSCFFRTSVDDTHRKALVQITERCNLHCAHCFVSSGNWGNHMSIADFRSKVIPRLLQARAERITLTGGEPFVHPDLMEMCSFVAELELPLGICTNGTQINDEQIRHLSDLGNVHVNVSFDGFRRSTHGLFRGSQSSFDVTVATTKKIAEAGLLQGILSTPNALSHADEFVDLCLYASDIGAKYVLFNPLSSFGRGVQSMAKLEAGNDKLRLIREMTQGLAREDFDITYIRFPNESLPLAGCDVGRLVYVFVNGDVAVCPYVVFAARTPQSKYEDSQFIVGNVLNEEISDGLDAYDYASMFKMGRNESCSSCSIGGGCGKGCPAAVIANGGLIGAVDSQQCAFGTDTRQVGPAA